MCMRLKRKRKPHSLYTLHPESQNEVHSKATPESGFSARDDPTMVTSTSTVKSCASQVPNIESSRSANLETRPPQMNSVCYLNNFLKMQGKKMQVGQFSVSVLTRWSWTTQCVLSSFLTILLPITSFCLNFNWPQNNTHLHKHTWMYIPSLLNALSI